MPLLQTITKLTLIDLQPLIDSSTAEGNDFVQKLWDEYQSGKNNFSATGDVLLGVYEDDHLIGVGGVHKDPYLNLPTAGRIRHVYVLPGHRRGGVGKQLVQALIDQASNQFTLFTLRTTTNHGQAFYKSLGFSNEPRFPNTTHWREKQT